MDEDAERERTLYHEAGHCVMAVVSGAWVERASVEPEEDGFHGLVDIRWPRRSNRIDQISVALAGPVAEMIIRSEPFHPGFVPEWAHDWKQAWTLCRPSCPSDRECLRRMEGIVAKLYHLLSQDRWWAAVSAVSDMLDAHDEIEHETIAYEVRNWLE
jgi:hypothetical protein